MVIREQFMKRMTNNAAFKISVEVLDNYKTRDEIRRVYVSE